MNLLVLLLLSPTITVGFLQQQPHYHDVGRPITAIYSSAADAKTSQVELSSGVSAEVLSLCPTAVDTTKPPLVFIHGSFHSSWCWNEYWMEYFVKRGYPCLALSLRGTHGTFAGEGVTKVKISEHAADIQAFLNVIDTLLPTISITPPTTTASSTRRPLLPVLISHSFGGAAIMKYMETYPGEIQSKLSGVIMLCSVPPSGNGPMTVRFLKRSIVQSWKITAGFALKRCVKNSDLCRDLFFGGPKKQKLITSTTGLIQDDDDHGVSDDDIIRYQSYFKRDTTATIDVGDFVRQLPSKNWIDGLAPFLPNLPKSSTSLPSSSSSSSAPVVLVCGATRDFLVDQQGVEETAKYFGVYPPTMIDSPHDVMIGRNWEKGASVIYNWLQSNGL